MKFGVYLWCDKKIGRLLDDDPDSGSIFNKDIKLLDGFLLKTFFVYWCYSRNKCWKAFRSDMDPESLS